MTLTTKIAAAVIGIALAGAAGHAVTHHHATYTARGGHGGGGHGGGGGGGDNLHPREGVGGPRSGGDADPRGTPSLRTGQDWDRPRDAEGHLLPTPTQ